MALAANLAADTVFVGAPMAGGGRGAVYVFRRGQASYERSCGLGGEEADGTRGGRGTEGLGERGGWGHASFGRTRGGTGGGGGWGLVEILLDSTPSFGSLFGSSLATAASAFSTSSSSSSSSHPDPPASASAYPSTLLVVGSPGYSRQGRAELEAALPDGGCALVFRRSPLGAGGDGGSVGRGGGFLNLSDGWVLEDRLLLSGVIYIVY